MLYTIGETVMDIIFEGNQPRAAKPGGSALNTAVTLGRLGLPVSFISEWGHDEVGGQIEAFLNENQVATNHAYRFPDAQTGLALAFLDSQKNASYLFYKQKPAKHLDIVPPEIQENDIVLFSSFFAINKEVRPKLLELLTKANKAGALCIYDPNFRKPHAHEKDNLLPLVNENISMADIVRGSDEDFINLFQTDNPDEVYKLIKKEGCQVLFYTMAGKGVVVYTDTSKFTFDVPHIEPVSTIGAGDNFNAGIIYTLYSENITRDALSQMQEGIVKKAVSHGIAFSQDVCLSTENYICIEMAGRFKIKA